MAAVGDEAFMTPEQRIRFRAEVDSIQPLNTRFYRTDQADRTRMLEGQRVSPREWRKRARYWLIACYRVYQVELWAAVVTGLSIAAGWWWLR